LEKTAKDYERYKNLFAGGGLTEQELDDMKNKLESAKIGYEQAQKQLSDATVKSPISGTITSKKVEEGNFVNVGTAIATIVDISKLKVKLNVSETSVYLLNIGDKAIISSEAYPGILFTGNISFISPKGNNNHTYPVEIVIPNSNAHPLKAGSFVSVTIKQKDKGKKLCIPRQALQSSINDAQVYVAQNGKAVLKNIIVNNGDNSYLEVVSGLNEGEQVITTGQINLSDGKTIKILK
jgi:RND family efflux transporter MFP subunit